VVGSGFVRVIENHAASAELEQKLETLARELKQGACAGRMASGQ
jgi:tryptophan synthase alpha subunit